MPIRINLLAEAQALEELRRRDPVKRALWVGVFLVILTLAISSWFQLQILIRKGELNRVEGQVASRTNEYQTVLAKQRKLGDAMHRLAALNQMATNRLLYGTLLNALQQTSVESVRLTRLNVDQSYILSEAIKPKTNGTKVIPAIPPRSIERVVVSLTAVDGSPNQGGQVNKFKQALGENPYFRTLGGKTNEFRLTGLSSPQASDRASVQFTLECRPPERIR